MSQYQNNLGKIVVLNRANAVTNQYGMLGAEGRFQTVFDSSRGPSADIDDSQLRIYNIATWLGGYNLPAPVEDQPRKLCILGKLQYGIGGATFEVDFDWKLGTQLSVCASYVRIMAAFSEVVNAPDSVSIGAMMSSGGRASRAQTTRTYPMLSVNNAEGSAVIFPIPPMAFALNLFSAEETFYDADEVTVRYLSAITNSDFSSTSQELVSFKSDASPFLAALSGDGLRFPESAKFVQVTTSASENGLLFTPSFTLSL
jgi:hypothetical protein